jgi:hypothetical protein
VRTTTKKGGRERLERSPRESDRLLVRNVDDLIDAVAAAAKVGHRLDEMPGYAAAFPRAVGIGGMRPAPRRHRDRSRRLVCHLRQRMRRAWHDGAESWVYAFAYKGRLTDERREQLRRKRPRPGRRSTWLESAESWVKFVAPPLVKVGVTATHPEHRRQAHVAEYIAMQPYLAEWGMTYEPVDAVLILPCHRRKGAAYLEPHVFGTLPEGDQVHCEWYRASWPLFGVLAGWFVAAHACSRPAAGKGGRASA